MIARIYFPSKDTFNYWIKFTRNTVNTAINTEEYKDRRQGQHIYISKNKYIGEWKFGRRNGHGKMTYKCGSVYEGHWENDLRSGLGRLNYVTGCCYEGHWKADLQRFISFFVDNLFRF